MLKINSFLVEQINHQAMQTLEEIYFSITFFKWHSFLINEALVWKSGGGSQSIFLDIRLKTSIVRVKEWTIYSNPERGVDKKNKVMVRKYGFSQL